MNTMHYIFVAIGGALGAVARLSMAKIVPQAMLGLPTYILVVNVVGCLAMGLFTELFALHWSPPEYVRYVLIPGFLGGFTTFSAFSLEFGMLIERHDYMLAFVYAGCSFLLSTLAFFSGLKIVRVLG